MVLLPNVFNFMNANDASFETATSSKIKILKLYHKHNVATISIGLVIAHQGALGDRENIVLCHKMLKQGLRLDRVHTFTCLCPSQLEEKFTWVVEMTTDSSASFARLQEQIALVVIVNLGDGFFLESSQSHKDHYDSENKRNNWTPQSSSKAPDSTINYKNYTELEYKDPRSKKRFKYKNEFLSMVDLSVRITNNSQNFILMLEVANCLSQAYYSKKRENPHYLLPVDSLSERPGL